MRKRALAVLAVSAFSVGILAGCGSGSSSSSTSSAASTTASAAASTSAAAASTTAASAAETTDSGAADSVAADGDTTITVAATQTPHSEILAAIKDELAGQGYDLEVTVFEDYVQPNNVVESGDFDANYFQHVNYLNAFNEEQGTHLAIAENGRIHYEPFGIYGGTKTSLDDLSADDTIAVPNDTTNEARALLLLQQEGIIKLNEGAGITATVNDIDAANSKVAPSNIIEVEAAQVPKQLPSVSYGVINGNYALEAGLNVSKDALATESAEGEAIQQYVNVIAVEEGNESLPKIKALTDALHSQTAIDYINNTYEGAVVPYDGEQ